MNRIFLPRAAAGALITRETFAPVLTEQGIR